MLDDLDGRCQKGRAEARSTNRYRYRASRLHLEINSGSEAIGIDAVSRNLSATGVSLVVGRFIYPGSRCRIELVSVHNYHQQVTGLVRRCRYLTGSANLHEIGVQFEQRIDVARFNRAARIIDTLLFSDDESLARLLPILSAEQPLRVRHCPTLDALLAAADNRVPLAILEPPPGDRGASLEALRAAGYVRPVAALVNEPAEAEGFGHDLVIRKPLGAADVSNAIVSLLDEPLISTMVNDECMAELIDQFVAGLPGVVEMIQQARRKGEREKLIQMLDRLRGQAGSYGFETITIQAGDAVAELRSDAGDASVVRLLRSCLSAQPIHCSA